MMYLIENTFSQTMNDEASRIFEYRFISKANSKFFQQEFTLSRAARALEIPKVLRFKHAVVFLFLSR